MATAAVTFHQTWFVGRRVQETSAPHRTGTIRNVLGTGPDATVIVGLDGGTVTSFRPSQLTPL